MSRYAEFSSYLCASNLHLMNISTLRLITAAALLLAATCLHASRFGLVKIPMAPLREEPAHEAEMGTQAMLGTPVRLDSIAGGEWWALEMPCGYRGYIHVSSIAVLSHSEAEAWKLADRQVAIANIAYLQALDATGAKGYVPYGGVVEYVGPHSGGMIEVALPSGEHALGHSQDFIDLKTAAATQPDAAALERVIARGMSMKGAPYLWGGTSPLAPDCSGFTQMCWREAGLLLPRNASQQALVGEEVRCLEEALRGDMLFFASPTGRIDHVGIYLGEGRMIQSSGIVYEATMRADDASPELPFYRRRPASIRRLCGFAALPFLRDNEMYFAPEALTASE